MPLRYQYHDLQFLQLSEIRRSHGRHDAAGRDYSCDHVMHLSDDSRKTRWSYDGKTGKKKIKQAVFETIGVLISFLVLIPFLMVLVNSMKSKRQANLLQLNLKGISLGQIVENYGTVIKEARLVSSFLNSAIVTFCGSALVLTFASMAAFVVVRRKQRP